MMNPFVATLNQIMANSQANGQANSNGNNSSDDKNSSNK